jgi:hypothetical protein
MSFFPFFSTIQHHASWFKNISIEEFANRTAYDCMNNPYSDKYDDLMSYISCANEISSDSTGALQTFPSTARIQIYRRCCFSLKPSFFSF